MQILLAATIKLISNSVVGRLAFLGFTIWLARTQDETAYSSILFLYSAFMFFAWLGGGGFYLGALRSYRDSPGAFVLLRHLYLKKLKIAIIAIVSLFLIYLTLALPSSAPDNGTAPILTKLLQILPLAAALPFVVLTRFHVAQLQYQEKYFYSGFIQFSGKTLLLIACFSILFFPLGQQVIATFGFAVFLSSAIILLVVHSTNKNFRVLDGQNADNLSISFRQNIIPFIIAGAGVQIFFQTLMFTAVRKFGGDSLGGILTCLTLASQGFMLLQSLTTVAFAKLRRGDRRRNSEIITSYYKIMLILVPISLVALWWLADPILSLFDASFQKLSMGLFFLCASWLLYFAKGPLTTILAVNGYPSIEGAIFSFVALIGLVISFNNQFSSFQYLIFVAILIQVVSVVELLSLFIMRGFLKVR